MKLGIVGLPNVGKSTLFNSLTKAGAESANYPFCTIDPNVGIVTVPDARVDYLAEKYHSKKVIPASYAFLASAAASSVLILWIGNAPNPFLFTVIPVLPNVTVSIALPYLSLLSD